MWFFQPFIRSLIKFTRIGWKDFSNENAKNLSDEAKMFTQQVVGAILSPDTQLVRVTRSAPVCEAIAKMVDGNVRRLVVVDELGKTVNIITQFDIVKYLYEVWSSLWQLCDHGACGRVCYYLRVSRGL